MFLSFVLLLFSFIYIFKGLGFSWKGFFFFLTQHVSVQMTSFPYIVPVVILGVSSTRHFSSVMCLNANFLLWPVNNIHSWISILFSASWPETYCTTKTERGLKLSTRGLFKYLPQHYMSSRLFSSDSLGKKPLHECKFIDPFSAWALHFLVCLFKRTESCLVCVLPSGYISVSFEAFTWVLKFKQ